MATHPYLHFQGQAAEALAFYAEVLSGTDLRTILYEDGPEVPEMFRGSNRVMHGQVRIGDGLLMASDFPPGWGEAQKAVSVMQTFADVPSARAAYDRFLDGGDAIQEFGPSFFSPGFGMVRDRFGTHWIVSADAQPEPTAAEAAEPEAHPT